MKRCVEAQMKNSLTTLTLWGSLYINFLWSLTDSMTLTMRTAFIEILSNLSMEH